MKRTIITAAAALAALASCATPAHAAGSTCCSVVPDRSACWR